jgi:hypothetical protein
MKEGQISAAGFIRAISQGIEDSSILFGNFLDAFYRANIDDKNKLLSDEPEPFNNVYPIDYVNIAATVHKLANDSSIPAPTWVFKEQYYAKEPFFPVHHPDLKLIYMFESPTEFKHRNMFVSANALSRV